VTAEPAATAFTAEEIAARWERWAESSRHRARTELATAGQFDATLWGARARARTEAARLLRVAPDVLTAAGQIHALAAQHRIRTQPTLTAFDDAARDYTMARVWQECAAELAPGLPEVQPEWD
jgi:hypothetical protein